VVAVAVERYVWSYNRSNSTVAASGNLVVVYSSSSNGSTSDTSKHYYHNSSSGVLSSNATGTALSARTVLVLPLLVLRPLLQELLLLVQLYNTSSTLRCLEYMSLQLQCYTMPATIA
jgi:hypothetical protein